MDIAHAQRILGQSYVSQAFKKDFLYGLTKRALDVSVASIALLVLSPLLLTVGLLIKLTSKGSALYWQDRVGQNGQIISFPKMRSMVEKAHVMIAELKANNDHGDSITFKQKNDPRVTPIGRLIRKFSIDELPQLWLVLTGKLTLVGPRPALVTEVEEYTLEEHQRLLVKPGLTCIWQVSGRGDIPFSEQLKMDMDYIRTRSTLVDLKLLLLTIPAVITGRGAY